MDLIKMQFGAIVSFTILTVMLTMVPTDDDDAGRAYNRSRWMLAVGMALIAIHFMVQYTFQIRVEHGGVAAGLVNTAFLLPAGVLSNLGMLNVLQLGHVRKWQIHLGTIGYAAFVIATAAACLLTGANPILDTPNAAITFAALFGQTLCTVTLAIYFVSEIKLYYKIKRSLVDFFDQAKEPLIEWTYWSVMARIVCTLSGTFVFVSGDTKFSALMGTISLSVLFYQVVRFMFFGMDMRNLKKANEVVPMVDHYETVAQSTTDEPEPSTTMEDNEDEAMRMEEVRKAVTIWTENHGFAEPGINLTDVSQSIGVPSRELSLYINNVLCKRFRDWLTDLRIEEAKNVIKAHPDWSLETVAQECGFSSRTYFQTTFKQRTGLTPNQFIASVE